MSVLYSRAAHLFERRNNRINLDFNLECLLYLVEVGQLRDLVPEIPHDLAVLLVPLVAPLPLGLDHRVADGQALKVVAVEEPVVVDVVHEADDELDAVLPAVRHRDS